MNNYELQSPVLETLISNELKIPMAPELRELITGQPQTTMARPVNDIDLAFAAHTRNQYPPKIVFFATPDGELQYVKLSEVSTLSERFTLVGMTDDSFEHAHFRSGGNLPILEAKETV